jgi:hypothetical protein
MRKLRLDRAQLNTFLKDQDMIGTFEELFTLSDNIFTLQKPLSAVPSGNVTFQLPEGSENYQIYIPKANLVASSGGPFTLSIGCKGVGAHIEGRRHGQRGSFLHGLPDSVRRGDLVWLGSLRLELERLLCEVVGRDDGAVGL